MSTRRRSSTLSRALGTWRMRRRSAPLARGHDPDHAPPEWRDLGAELGHPAPLKHRLAHDWALVLLARGVEHQLSREGRGWRLRVPSDMATRAAEEVTAYMRENRHVHLARTPKLSVSVWPTALAMGGLLLFFSLTRTPLPSWSRYPPDWLKLGAAHAKDILDGEWWRLATALTLHADAAHVLGNVVVGTLFTVPLCAVLSTGPAWLVVMTSGVLGNLLNALAQNPEHSSIGFSTAVFGAAGALAATRAWRGRRWFTPLAAGLGLLAILGAGGENTDLGAHLFGFAAGLGLGWGASRLVRRFGLPGRGMDAALAALAVALPVMAWLWAG